MIPSTFISKLYMCVRLWGEGLSMRCHEFIQIPRYIVDSWSTPLSTLHHDFWSTDSLLEMFVLGKPTSKTIALFDANPETSAHRDAFSSLKRFVQGMEEEKMTKFVRFYTGSKVVSVEKININFNNLDGA